jgi:hypothetical protein
MVWNRARDCHQSVTKTARMRKPQGIMAPEVGLEPTSKKWQNPSECPSLLPPLTLPQNDEKPKKDTLGRFFVTN